MFNSKVAVINGSSKYTWRTKYHCFIVQRLGFHSRFLYCYRTVFRNFANHVPSHGIHFNDRCTIYVWEPMRKAVVLVKRENKNFPREFLYRCVKYRATSSLIWAAQCLLFSLWLGLTCNHLFHCKINSLCFFQGMLHVLLGKCTLQDFVNRAKEAHFSFTSD